MTERIWVPVICILTWAALEPDLVGNPKGDDWIPAGHGSELEIGPPLSATRPAKTALQPPDLTPVTWMATPSHPPVEIVRGGQSRAAVYVADPRGRQDRDSRRPGEPPRALQRLVEELVEVVRLRTGVTLELLDRPPAADRPAIVIGDCEETRKAGVDAERIPVEGFVVKTTLNRVYLVGSTQALAAGSNRWAQWDNEGTAWAVADFLERFVGVRWYWPADLGGRCISPGASLVIPAAHYRDQPVFRMRKFHPGYGWKLPQKACWSDPEPLAFAPGAIPEGVTAVTLASYLPLIRAGNSWPYLVKVHEPQRLWRQWDSKWSQHPELLDMFEQKKDGTRNLSMLCYSSPKTLAYLLEGCADAWERGKPVSWVTPTCVTVSPADMPLNCQCEVCKATTAKGGASLVMGLFVKKMCEEVKRRWPDKKVIFLAYWNYQKCPQGVEFPDNLETMVCTTGGPMALMRQTNVRLATENNLRAWSERIGRPITDWDYSDRGGGWTHGPVQFPHLARDFYRTNRDYLAGSFLNGGGMTDWTTAAPTLYVWMKALWNPEVDVDALLDEMCRRLYGKAGDTVRELLRLECDRWQAANWTRPLFDGGVIYPALFREIWPPDVVARMQALRGQALAETADDPLARQRFLYWTWTFDAFLKEAAAIERKGSYK